MIAKKQKSKLNETHLWLSFNICGTLRVWEQTDWELRYVELSAYQLNHSGLRHLCGLQLLGNA